MAFTQKAKFQNCKLQEKKQLTRKIYSICKLITPFWARLFTSLVNFATEARAWEIASWGETDLDPIED